jgi:sorbitol-specific phosphotransferase system component IIBC
VETCCCEQSPPSAATVATTTTGRDEAKQQQQERAKQQQQQQRQQQQLPTEDEATQLQGRDLSWATVALGKVVNHEWALGRDATEQLQQCLLLSAKDVQSNEYVRA